MVEAMAARLAVVISAVGAVPELIKDRRSGLLVEPRDVASLIRALGEIIDDRALRERLALEGHRIAARDFEVESAVRNLVELITTTIAAGRERRLSGRVP
jgi:glycosyltransferase involved in cell wall biosynthesis